jgi:peptidoglycan/LPS O-acetylase OafA/YrhL
MDKYLYKKKIHFLDFIRCMATIQIVLFHYVCATQLPNKYVLLWGREGVALFFMISGCGLVNKYYYNLSVLDFYKRRFLGIIIPFWVAYIGAFIWKYFGNGFHTVFNQIPIENGIYTLIGVDGFLSVCGIPTFYLIGEWYMGALMIVYLFFPLWIYVFKRHPYGLVVID